MKQYLAVAVVLAAAAGCDPNDAGNLDVQCAALTTTTATPPAQWSGSVFTIVMENKSRGDIFGNSSAPFINQLAKQHAVADGYHDSYVHPSEPNYLEMVAGENFGILDDNDPSSHSVNSTSHIADQLELAGLSWKTYQESMGAPCGLVSHGRYAAKHDPFVYFDDINGWDGKQFQPSPRCQDHVVDYSQLDADIAANQIPKYVFITPNLDDDMHDGSIAQGDLWLSTEMPKIMATDAYKNGGVIFLLWDEGSGTLTPGDDPPFLAISPHAVAGEVSKTNYDTSSYLKTVQGMLGLDPVPCAKDPATVSVMTDLFSVPVSTTAQ
ncbi:MAG TPA: alkaline phosphatase family protein [Kofleriaceae bacterium]|nr:alkaline phosphatase family protein [Kofleriaceae bacterium]